jgi:RNA polymerase sigma factor (sigma-70 family)
MTTTPSDFDDRFDELARIAYRVAFRLTGSPADAEDIAQESLARASVRWRKIGPYAEAWVTRVATNLALGRLRKARPVAGESAPAADSAQLVADRHALVELVRRLPRRQRQAVTLRFLADLPEARVAELLGCSVGSVKQHTSRGLAALRTGLRSDPDDPRGELRVPTA